MADQGKTSERPKCCRDAHLVFLDQLRESGKTNMWGAAAYLRKSFVTLSDEQAGQVLLYWMGTFTDRHPETRK